MIIFCLILLALISAYCIYQSRVIRLQKKQIKFLENTMAHNQVKHSVQLLNAKLGD